MRSTARLVFVESNTTGSGRAFCAAARARGLEPLLITRDPGRYPYVEQDRVDTAVTDTGDPSRVLRVCRELGAPVAGVTSSSEYFVATAAATALALGLPAPDPGAVTRCRDKARQRDTLAAAGVPVPAFHEVATVAAGLTAARTLIADGHRAVVKPVLGSGSDGVRLCASPGEASAALGSLLAPGTAGAGRVLVEEYMEGPEFSVETFDDRVVGVTAKRLGAHPRFVETGHEFPATLPDHLSHELAETALKALARLGLGWGPAHVELRLTASGPKVVEVNPRLAGGMIPAAVEAATAVDLVGATVDRVLGGTPDLAPKRYRSAAVRFLFATRPGTVRRTDATEATRLPGVVSAAVTPRRGARIDLTQSFRDRVGHAIAVGADTAEAAHNAERAVGALVLLTAAEDPVTIPAD